MHSRLYNDAALNSAILCCPNQDVDSLEYSGSEEDDDGDDDMERRAAELRETLRQQDAKKAAQVRLGPSIPCVSPLHCL